MEKAIRETGVRTDSIIYTPLQIVAYADKIDKIDCNKQNVDNCFTNVKAVGLYYQPKQNQICIGKKKSC